METLPVEILEIIFYYTEGKALINCMNASQRFKKILLDSPTLWLSKCVDEIDGFMSDALLKCLAPHADDIQAMYFNVDCDWYKLYCWYLTLQQLHASDVIISSLPLRNTLEKNVILTCHNNFVFVLHKVENFYFIICMTTSFKIINIQQVFNSYKYIADKDAKLVAVVYKNKLEVDYILNSLLKYKIYPGFYYNICCHLVVFSTCIISQLEKVFRKSKNPRRKVALHDLYVKLQIGSQNDLQIYKEILFLSDEYLEHMFTFVDPFIAKVLDPKTIVLRQGICSNKPKDIICQLEVVNPRSYANCSHIFGHFLFYGTNTGSIYIYNILRRSSKDSKTCLLKKVRVGNMPILRISTLISNDVFCIFAVDKTKLYKISFYAQSDVLLDYHKGSESQYKMPTLPLQL